MSPRSRPKFLAGLLALLAVGVIGSGCLIAWRSYSGMHRLLEAATPSPLLANPRLTGIDRLVAVTFVSRDGLRLKGWYVPPREGASVIVTPGAMSDRSTMLAEMRLLADAGFGVLAFDWPGTGESEGTIRWNGQARRALTAAIDWLSSRGEVDAERIGGLGFSMGGVVLTQIAATDPRIRAVVLEAPAPDFRDYIHVNSRRWGDFSEWVGALALHDSGLLDPAFEPTNLVGRIAPRPVLIIGGTDDHAVPGPSLTKLYNAAREPKSLWMIPGAGHGNYHTAAAAQYTSTLTEFFGTHLRRR